MIGITKLFELRRLTILSSEFENHPPSHTYYVPIDI